MGKEIGSLTAASTLTGAELLHVIQAGNSRQTTVGALPAWKVAASWAFSTNVGNVDFTGLAGYNELMAVVRGITTSASGTLVLQVSTDNGSTFRSTSGDYVTIGATGAETNSIAAAGFNTGNLTSARSGYVWIPQAGLNGVVKPIHNFAAGVAAMFVQSTSPINALRIVNTAGGNLTAGSAWVLGR
ncbi:MAG: hypothetical protein EOS81_10615 [Mesorhizobium sp.]|uniref:hypothetical protein n=1 Tax=unclassified Mesorhizobium TaxID=325217 RepID=UPI000F74C266|nr:MULTISPECIES: hypothetical protein [unclassified Mesorhizobium]RVC68085.1 hypothetical protein EN759_13055 [Mesorhizobium sp. M00.F.Ca.ET.038.03.1.1]RVC70029.1 hypothetical protein EN766_28520 [Mesorhizobium sp. M2A.F.Ca.ET.046.02.1.1]AZO38639.1 hypothetical protein EJ072_32435 [Mesorhizobium sp. M2A.F.Ca.ET.046.03.2.1]RWB37617.1 MAG: hypothetical protein EOQ44_32815 [Mesorhizobium sp.]RWE18785.1 MAG: hypothetical protein EOS76_14840 [Mesorhizobium sp.]